MSWRKVEAVGGSSREMYIRNADILPNRGICLVMWIILEIGKIRAAFGRRSSRPSGRMATPLDRIAR